MSSTNGLKAEVIFDVGSWVCLVTGGGTGIGLMCAQALAANGAKVYIVGRRQEALDQAVKAHNPESGSGSIVACKPCDVTKKAELEKLVAEIESKESQLDLLGISGPKAEPEHEDASEVKKRLWENENESDWANVFNTDVTSVYFTTVAFLPLLQAASKSRGHMSASVITISSMSGIMRHAQGHFSYNAAKGATVQLTKLMSGEFIRNGIRANSIAPGYFPSEMTAKESNDEQKSHLPAEKVQDKGHVPADRPGADEEMAQAVLFLAKNRYVNGEILAVDGGVLSVVAGR